MEIENKEVSIGPLFSSNENNNETKSTIYDESLKNVKNSQIDSKKEEISNNNNTSKTNSTKGGLFIWGKGGDPQLGFSDFKDHLIPEMLPKLSGKDFVSMSGRRHIIASTTNSEVWAWGWNDYGQLGQGDVSEQLTPVPIKFFALIKAVSSKPTRIITVSCGSEFSAALTENGIVYTWGDDKFGQLGNHDGIKLVPRQVLSLHKEEIIEISCGASHILACSRLGVVFSWGKGADGRLGHGSEENICFPTMIKSLINSKIKCIKISCGWSHSMIISEQNQVYTFGKGTDGQLGHGDRENQLYPKMIELLVDLKAIYVNAGYHHSAIILDNGKVFTFGWAEYGQLGLGKLEYNNMCLPQFVRQLPNHSPAIQVSCGEYHSLILLKNGEIYSCGFGEGGQLGHGNRENFYIPTLIQELKNYKIQKICCGNRFSMASYSSEMAQIETNTNNQEASLITEWDAERESSKILDTNPSISLYQKLTSWFLDSISLNNPKKGEEEWFSILENFEVLKNHPRTKILWRRGIPVNVRGEVWKRAIGNDLGLHEDKFEELRIKASEIRKKENENQSENQRLIEVDLPRTWPALKFFNNTGPFYSQLLLVLETFALHFEKLGYVQGMSYIAGMLCLYLDPYDSFIALCNLINTRFLTSLFMLNAEELKSYLRIYDLLFYKQLPELYKKFSELQISPELYLLDWFMTLFSKSFPLSVASRIWDCYIFEGEVILYRASVGILSYLSPKLEKMGFEEIARLLSSLETSTLDEAKLFDCIFKIDIPHYIKELLFRSISKPRKK